MFTVNQKCNALQSIIGIFLHGHNAPEKVSEVLSRMGISISMTAIHKAIKALSADAMRYLWKLGRRRLIAYCYDNFDVTLKSAKWTLEASKIPSLKHLTSGLFISLPPGTRKSDLKCSEYLWRRSRLNDLLPDNRPGLAPKPDFERMLGVHPQYWDPDSAGMNGSDRWNAWKFLDDLIHHGPMYFRQFSSRLRPPEIIDPVPLAKTECTPARAMDLPNSTVSGNIDTLMSLLKQGGIYSGEMTSHGPGNQQASVDDESDDDDDDEKMANPKPIGDYVVLVHGDLGTGERVTQALRRRAIEKTPWKRLQFAVYVLSLFHLKMACADAVWRLLIQPVQARQDKTSVMQHVGILREKETGTIAKDPGFRRMHQVITHDGRCRRLQCWLQEVRANGGYETLEEWCHDHAPEFA